jgi:Domain of unknown function (DU1801)
MTHDAASLSEFLASLPEDRREAISKVRAVIRKNLPKGYVEQFGGGMIHYVVPHKLFPAGYHCDPSKPLAYLSLASQKNHMAIYAMCVYQDQKRLEWLRAEFAAQGKKLDMGKSCIRFKKLENLPLDVIGRLVASVPVADYVQGYEDALKVPKN